ncbi:MAG: hypothetical protein COW01_08160 [Bdellovibrionales bacterium CG12_big_fil_rev_8_21_14_0_65_38_15]|nr:MAG: hypothetical protein COW79_10630 [Bdellovibrionales bacterium CG22_combo_CG10-13_8_21_14_all_38_13]PIQ55344.1 MAG: hypothetical protein COW01_08160 [Bdellovibrionales bacterium CG12_big_fil_rev_8_21_14_0_65_38_15]PIR28954.1 MAG: hypothetical protein COV38_13205 [Bdellovibrionales bacterium CG11_big_fil_rev_8_21_14_0_20_38_13]
MKKAIGFTILIIFVGVGLYFYQKNESSLALNDRALNLRNASIAHTQNMPSSLRKPASVEPTTDVTKKDSSQKRQWIGAKDDIIQSGKIAMKNKPDNNWHDKLVSILSRGINSKTKIEVNHEKSVVLVNGNDAVNAEQVVVIFNADKERNSYRAMVNSQTGKVIRTWDHTIHENTRMPASLSGLPLTLESQD